ncbi:hypothetical protein BgiBS90_030688 [Biomphalaria glabrata]|nr:hypothetical protein BgiBS90_030688 [Biomphalaria glabrata]
MIIRKTHEAIYLGPMALSKMGAVVLNSIKLLLVSETINEIKRLAKSRQRKRRSARAINFQTLSSRALLDIISGVCAWQVCACVDQLLTSCLAALSPVSEPAISLGGSARYRAANILLTSRETRVGLKMSTLLIGQA